MEIIQTKLTIEAREGRINKLRKRFVHVSDNEYEISFKNSNIKIFDLIMKDGKESITCTFKSYYPITQFVEHLMDGENNITYYSTNNYDFYEKLNLYEDSYEDYISFNVSEGHLLYNTDNYTMRGAFAILRDNGIKYEQVRTLDLNGKALKKLREVYRKETLRTVKINRL